VFVSVCVVLCSQKKKKEIDMEFTRDHSAVRMLVEVTRPEYIPATTIDHTYEGKGYGLIFKLEVEKSKDKIDVDMQEASTEDDPKDSDSKDKELPKRDEPPSMDMSTKTSSGVNKIPPKTSNVTPKQALALSMPVLRVGSIDCKQLSHSEVLFWSERKVLNIVPRKLWGDSDVDEEDSLPSPLPRLSSPMEENLPLTGHMEVLPRCSDAAANCTILAAEAGSVPKSTAEVGSAQQSAAAAGLSQNLSAQEVIPVVNSGSACARSGSIPVYSSGELNDQTMACDKEYPFPSLSVENELSKKGMQTVQNKEQEYPFLLNSFLTSSSAQTDKKNCVFGFMWYIY
jgi:hypothetical protein